MNDDDFKIIKGEINCSSINKDRLFQKDGKPGKRLKVVLIRKKERDKFGRIAYMIKEDVTQAERQQGIEGGFIGDAYVNIPKGQGQPAPAAQPAYRPAYKQSQPGKRKW